MPKKPPRLKCLDHLLTEEEQRAWDQLDEARRQAAERWRDRLGPGALEWRRMQLEALELGEVYLRAIGHPGTQWSRPEEADSKARMDTARRWGWSPHGLFDLAPPREKPLPKKKILRPPKSPPKPLTREQAKNAKLRAAATALIQRSVEFAWSWVAYRVAASLVRFLRALQTDVNKKARALRQTALKHLSADEAREAVYQKYVRPELPLDLLDALPLDHLPAVDHFKAMVDRARKTPKPDPAGYFRDLTAILRDMGYTRLRANYNAKDIIIGSIGLDRIDQGWVRVWDSITVDEEQRHGVEQENLTEP